MTKIPLPGHDIIGIRAGNPGPFTLSGTNSWIVGRDPAWLIDPGPALPEHLATLTEELRARGGLGGIALTHQHPDHTEAVMAMRERFPQAAVAAAAPTAELRLSDGQKVGPLEAMALPGHAPDHLVFLSRDVAFTGDAVLGQGSVFIHPDPHALSQYMAGLERLRARRPALLAPGHGPLVVDADAKLAEYITHRLDRERGLLEALAAGKRTPDELLDAVWDDVPRPLRPAAAVTLAAHLDKLSEEGRLPRGVTRPVLPDLLNAG